MYEELSTFFGSLISYHKNGESIVLRLHKGWSFNDFDTNPILNISFLPLDSSSALNTLAGIKEGLIDGISVDGNKLIFEEEYAGEFVPIEGVNILYSWSEYFIDDYKNEICHLNKRMEEKIKETYEVRKKIDEVSKFIENNLDRIDKKSVGLSKKNEGIKCLDAQKSLLTRVLRKLNDT